MEQRNEFDTSWGDYEAKRQWSYVHISLNKGWRIKLKAEKLNKNGIRYGMVWYNAVKTTQNNRTEEIKEKDENRTGQTRIEQNKVE